MWGKAAQAASVAAPPGDNPSIASRRRIAVKRLDQEPVHAGGKARLAIFGLGIGGQRQDAGACSAGFGFGGPDAPRRLKSVQPGHLHVHQHQIVGAAVRALGDDRSAIAASAVGNDCRTMAEPR